MSKILFHTPTGTTKPYPRSDNEPVVGLAAEYEVFDLIEPARPTFDPTTHEIRRLPEEIDTQAKTVIRGWEVVPREVEPVVVSDYALFRAMSADDEILLNNYIRNIQDIDAKREAKVHITRARSIHRRHPFVVQVAAILNKTDAQMDALFAAAQKLDQS
jgi:hypothetical protein